MNTALTWFKSSYSGSEGGDCVEVAFDWRKSSYSTEQGGACVEVAACPGTVHVRDSKVTEGPVLDLAPAAWAALTGWVGGGSR
ncbi:DUF397 domain-containing protein [Streptomyces antimicrobicus]|uniref:DUF397 domain-containing protein n=1 Tax=Streptomyces antimicrobicus TaxID=2883108 RepID=A0ABS8B308_9ACTN|nr:DUF397 domain-containing protein [Streptomyces antimicrobicus]MCB5178977.1 DUF397 domain-containing protein [Streptomyces antimicrobicus]